jgi:Fur family transcriptional regulator, ferric uptake regulator
MTQRRTAQRTVIAGVIGEAGGPLSVAEILDRAREQLPGLGIATVYRTVRMLEDAGELKTVSLPGEDDRYEPRDRGQHHHFRCRGCGRVFDVPGCALAPRLSLPAGFVVESHEITLYGKCAACAV